MMKTKKNLNFFFENRQPYQFEQKCHAEEQEIDALCCKKIAAWVAANLRISFCKVFLKVPDKGVFKNK